MAGVKPLMDSYYSKSRTALNKDEFAIAQVYNVAESLANSFDHGRYVTEWASLLASALRANAAEAETEEEREHYELAAMEAEIFLEDMLAKAQASRQ